MTIPSQSRSISTELVQQGLLHRGAVILAVTMAVAGFACSKKVAVPDLLNQDIQQATKTLQSLNLKVGNVTGVSGTVSPGAYVVSQNPKSGEQVAANSSVELVVQAPVVVPDLTDAGVTDAVNTLQALGLKVNLVKQSTLTAAGLLRTPKVIRQDPSAHTPVRANSLVTLTIESPPKLAGLLDRVIQDPSFEKLNPEYRDVVVEFLK